MLAALPLLRLALTDPRPGNVAWERMTENWQYPWIVANQALFRGTDAARAFLLARLPMIAVGVLLGLLVFRWTREAYGRGAAVAALSLYASDPNVLAHTRLVHTDVPFAALFFAGTYFYWRSLRGPTWPDALLASLAVGLAAATKYSFLVILPAWALIGVLALGVPAVARGSRPSPGRHLALVAGILVASLAAAWLVVWAAYGFRFSAAAAGPSFAFSRVMPESPRLQEAAGLVIGWRLLPEAWVYGILYAAKSLRLATVYLLGETSSAGFWLYFPVAFAVKTPLPTLLLLLAAPLVRAPLCRAARLTLLCLVGPALVYFAMAVASRNNIGIRHLLPVYPFLFVLAGGTLAALWTRGARAGRAVAVGLVLWQGWSVATTHPHYLAFFNEAAGGPAGGHRILVDSNLDWGQDLGRLKRWMDRNGVRRIALAYFGTADPEYYGIDATYLPGSPDYFLDRNRTEAPAPSHIAVSVTLLMGTHMPRGMESFYGALRARPPVASIGHSIRVYPARAPTG